MVEKKKSSKASKGKAIPSSSTPVTPVTPDTKTAGKAPLSMDVSIPFKIGIDEKKAVELILNFFQYLEHENRIIVLKALNDSMAGIKKQ